VDPWVYKEGGSVEGGTHFSVQRDLEPHFHSHWWSGALGGRQFKKVLRGGPRGDGAKGGSRLRILFRGTKTLNRAEGRAQEKG